MIVTVFWLGVFMSARGGTGGIAKLASSGLLIGTLIPGAVLVILGVVYLLQGNPSAAPMDADHLIPKWTGIASLVLIVNNFLSYSGMEMNAVHVGSLRDPKTQFPKAMFFACGLVLMIFILPALAISWVIPAQELSLTAGVMQAFDAFFAYFNLQVLVPIVAIALVCASAGGMLTWLAGPSKGLLQIARREGYLPPFFQHQNENEIPVNILVVQGARDDGDRAAVRARPLGVERLLDPQRDDDAGVPDRLPADVRRREEPAQAPAGRRARVPGARAHVPVRRRLPRLGGGDPDRLRAALAVRERQPGRLRRLDPRRHGAARPAAALAVPEAAKAQLEADRTGGVGMSDTHTSDDGDRTMYWLIAVFVGVLTIVALITYSGQKSNQEAQQKAQQLVTKFEKAGLPVPEDIDILTRTLGDDGGAVCDNPASALGKATLVDQITNGADFVGRRPVIIDRDLVVGELLILQTYCPEHLQDYRDKIDDYKYDNTVDF